VGVDRELAAITDNESTPHRVVAGAGDLPFADGSFDLVTSNMVFEHLEDPDRAIREIRRILRPHGRILLHTPNAGDVITVLARLVPNALHPALVHRLEGRAREDVYPTRFLFNRPSRIRRVLQHYGFQRVSIERLEHPDTFSHVPLIGSLERLWHRLAHRVPALRGTLLIDAAVDVLFPGGTSK
jgi:ubiquinone/menaquinone biosynthesis C-methylase UbiE